MGFFQCLRKFHERFDRVIGGHGQGSRTKEKDDGAILAELARCCIKL
jgi:hypothetical protein